VLELVVDVGVEDDGVDPKLKPEGFLVAGAVVVGAEKPKTAPLPLPLPNPLPNAAPVTGATPPPPPKLKAGFAESVSWPFGAPPNVIFGAVEGVGVAVVIIDR
jgi:hypothetical protein